MSTSTPQNYAHTACLLRSCISDFEHNVFYEKKKDEIGGFPALENTPA